MTLASSVALSLAEKVERTGGPRAGLVAWKALATGTGDAEARGTAVLAAFRCALRLSDRTAMGELTTLWARVDRGLWDGPLALLTRALVARGFSSEALALCSAEVTRHRSARALHAYARCLDVQGDARAVTVFAEAAERAAREGAADLERASRVRRAAWLARSHATVAAAIEEAKKVDPTTAAPPERLVLAVVLLLSPSRFVRSGALGELDALSTGPDTALATKALAECARFVDERLTPIGPLELDRLRAIFGRTPATAKALAMLDLRQRIATATSERELGEALAFDSTSHMRTRDALAGRDVSAGESLEDAVVALAARLCGERSPLDVLRRIEGSVAIAPLVPPQLFLAIEAALAVPDPDVGAVAGAVALALLRRSPGSSPPHGWMRLATALARRGHDEAAVLARHAAANANEPGAVDALGLAITRSGWEHWRTGDRTRALAALREAKALASRR